LPLIPKKLEEFPSRWPFPRGDLYHWIPLLNRFDSILESFCETYNLHEGFQMRDFGCDVLLNSGAPVDYRDDTPWDKARLSQLGYKDDGDCQLIVAVLKFTRMLLERCGNRSIYASSSHLNSLLNSTDLEVVLSTLRVGLELAQRYQASVKRMSAPSRQVSSALLANHYNIELDRVQCVAQPFAKTPIIRLSEPAPTTPASAGKGKEKERGHGAAQKNVASMYANDLVAIAAPDQADEGRWNGWGDIKMPYYPKPETADVSATETPVADRGGSSAPTTPTPLRRSSTAVTQTPRSHRVSSSDDSPTQRTLGNNVDAAAVSGPKYVEIRQSTVQSTSIYDLLRQCPPGMSDTSRYEFLNRLRICKALLGSAEDRQLALAVRLLAITNLAYIHPEPVFIEKALKQDNDEPRRFQLIYQLAELIHPSADGAKEVPRWLQAIAMALLEAILNYSSKYGDVLSALNANVNHGVLLYVIRKAVAEMKVDPEDDVEGQVREDDRWRDSLFSLTLHLAMGSRIGQDMAGAGLMEILVEMLNLRSRIASRSYSTVLSFLDSLIYAHQGTFAMLTSASGLDAIANLIIHTVNTSKALTAAGQGTKPAFHASLVDYDIPYYEQQTLKWLLKFIHHVMTNAFALWGNTDRLLRNLVDNSALLGSLRAIIQDMRLFGSVVWTNAATLLSDFINNDPTSFAAISESGMIQTFLEALTGRPVVMEQPPATPRPDAQDDEDPVSPSYSEQSVTFERDDRPHPPTPETLETPRDSPLAHGILPSNEAILAIPGVLNSISLNNSGMKMVVSSRAFESYLEIFESPDHVHCMQMDPELATNIGGNFDELARHHPALRPALSNAVIDMVARVVHLAKTKAQTAGWGAKLQVVDVEGNSVTADRTLLEKSSGVTPSSKGKEKDVGDTDVDMTDVSAPSVPSISSVDTTVPRLGPQSAGLTAPYMEITPYILALSHFLNQFMGTSNLKPAFVQAGGIELLLDLMEAPSLQDDFGDTNASRVLSQVVAQLIESNQIVGHPSLLNRILDTLSTLQPLIKREESYPFFGPFLIPDLSLRDSKGGWDQTMARKVADGTAVVKALVNFQNLIRTLYQSFPYSSRSQAHSLPQVNIYDYYTRLIKDLGPLLRQVLSEEMSIRALVPQNWTGSKLSLEREGDLVTPPVDDAAVADVLTASWTAGTQDASASSKSLSEEEQSTVQYRNFHTLRGLLHSILPSTLPFFQTTGKSLLQRRVTDPYLRHKHLGLAEALAETILDQLKPPRRESTINDYQYWIIMFHTVHEMLVTQIATLFS
jgi:E3 ubiquitin-protein ligase HUWE1